MTETFPVGAYGFIVFVGVPERWSGVGIQGWGNPPRFLAVVGGVRTKRFVLRYRVCLFAAAPAPGRSSASTTSSSRQVNVVFLRRPDWHVQASSAQVSAVPLFSG